MKINPKSQDNIFLKLGEIYPKASKIFEKNQR
jgi:hypothetical protein